MRGAEEVRRKRLLCGLTLRRRPVIRRGDTQLCVLLVSGAAATEAERRGLTSLIVLPVSDPRRNHARLRYL